MSFGAGIARKVATDLLVIIVRIFNIANGFRIVKAPFVMGETGRTREIWETSALSHAVDMAQRVAHGATDSP